MKLPMWAVNAIDEIDAGLFSGDTFDDEESLADFEWYIARWTRELKLKREFIENEKTQI